MCTEQVWVDAAAIGHVVAGVEDWLEEALQQLEGAVPIREACPECDLPGE